MEFNSTHIKIIAFFVTSFFFLIEALIHYNMGKSGRFSFSIPEKKTICKTCIFFSSVHLCSEPGVIVRNNNLFH